MQTRRVRSSDAAAAVRLHSERAGTIASRNGSATVAPRPRSTVRRGNCLPVMNAILVSLEANQRPPATPFAVVVAASALFIRHDGLFAIASTSADVASTTVA